MNDDAPLMINDCAGATTTATTATTTTSARTLLDLLLIGVVVLAVTLPGLGGSGRMSSTMEIGFAVTVQEGVREGHWMVPMQNGRPRFVKPPLPFWIAQGAGVVLGGDEGRTPVWVQRGCSAAAGLAGAFAIYAMGCGMFNRRAGLWSAAAWATSMLVVREMRYARHDIYLAAAIALAMLGIWQLWQREKIGWFVAGAGLFLAMQIKGPVLFFVALLPAMAFWWKLDRDPPTKWPGHLKPPRRWPVLVGLLGITLLSAVPLILWARHVNSVVAVDLSEAYVWETVGRFASDKVPLDPPWYYGQYFAYIMPWALLFIPAVVWAWRHRDSEAKQAMLFCLFWMIGALILMSLPKEKTGRYAVPFIAPASLLLGAWIAWLIDRRPLDKLNQTLRDIGITGTIVTLIAAAIALPIALTNKGWISTFTAIGVRISLGLVAVLAAVLFRREQLKAAFALVTLGGAIALVSYQVSEEHGRPPAGFGADAARIDAAIGDTPLYWWAEDAPPHLLAFELNRVIPRLTDPIALRAAGVDATTDRIAILRELDAASESLYVIVPESDLGDIRAAGVDLILIADNLIPSVPGQSGAENQPRALIRIGG